MLPEGTDVGKAVNEAMRDIEKHNPQLAGVLPRTYNLFTGTLLKELLKKVSKIPASIDYDAFGRIYEYFLGEQPDYTLGGDEAKAKLVEVFNSSLSAKGVNRKGGGISYRDVPGLCRVASLPEIEAQGWSLNPGRYVGVAPGEEVSDEDFKEKLETLNEELEVLNTLARDLEQTIASNVTEILEN